MLKLIKLPNKQRLDQSVVTNHNIYYNNKKVMFGANLMRKLRPAPLFRYFTSIDPLESKIRNLIKENLFK